MPLTCSAPPPDRGPHPGRRLLLCSALLLSAALTGACDRGGDAAGTDRDGDGQAAPAAGGEAASGGDAPQGTPGPGGPGGPLPEVTVVTLEPQRVQLTRELPGRVHPFRIAEVRPQVSGLIERRLFEEGAEVEEGQPLYQLEDDSYRAALRSARASVTRARAALNVAKENAERSRKLFEGGAISAQQHDTTEAALQLAQADLAAARAALQGQQVTVGYTRITAPISGRVGRSTVTEGALVTANQPDPLTTVQQLDPTYVDVSRSNEEWLELRQAVAGGRLERDEEAPVTILLGDGTRYPHRGRLRFSEVTVDPGTGSSLVRIEVPNPDAVLLPGMYVRAILQTGTTDEGLLVPQQGVTRDPSGEATALVVGDDGRVAARQLETSQTVGSSWLVSSGLSAGDRVIVEGVQKVQPGAQVRATERAADARGIGGAGPAEPSQAPSPKP